MQASPLALTMGDPAGIGPEVIVRSWLHPQLRGAVCRIVIAVPEVIEHAIRLTASPLRVERLHAPNQVYDPASSIGVLPLDLALAPGGWRTNGRRALADCGEAAFQALRLATDLAMRGEIAGIVTAPLNKEALQLAGHRFPGHTELLATWTGAQQHAMMLYLPPAVWFAQSGAHPAPLEQRPQLYPAGAIGLGVIHTTLHMRLRDIFSTLTPSAILASTELAVQFVRAMLAAEGQSRPERVAVAALNPHAGENGLFGDEEQTLIAPAVAAGQARGWNLSGPWPTDTLMHRAVRGEFDAVVAMYHDQGHIPLKLIGFDRAVNVTLGLPIVRTSVAHGTAFDIAWQGRANSSSMVAATLTAVRLVAARAVTNRELSGG